MEHNHIKPLSNDDLRIILTASERAGRAAYLLVLLLIITGQRINEVEQLEWHQLDLDEGIGPCRFRGGLALGPLPLSDLTLRILRHANRGSRSERDRVVLPIGKEQPFPAAARRMINQQIVNGTGCGLKWTLQQLRPTFAQGCCICGADSATIAQLLSIRGSEPWRPNEFRFPEREMQLMRSVLNRWSSHIEDLLQPRGVNFQIFSRHLSIVAPPAAKN